MTDYKSTLNLPKTNFSMKANLPNKEPMQLLKWNDAGIYELLRKKSKGRPKFILHDGPPYANGNIHMGHVLNKILKDIVVKFNSMKGNDAPYVPGWDCHGLPVEHQLFKELKMTKSDIDQVAFRNKAYKYAMKYVKIQRDEFKRLGIFGDWENPYLTLDTKYEAGIMRSFAALVKKGFVYKGLKPVNWCATCETALAEAEVEYANHNSHSVFVRFKLVSEDAYFVIWTTTPWTLLANVAIAVHPTLDYVLVSTRYGKLYLMKDRLDAVMNAVGENEFKVIKTIKGKTLEGLQAKHPFIERISKIVLADYITTEEGTGCVHIAPGHGEADYITGKKYKLPTIMPIDSKGKVDDSVPEFKGLGIKEASLSIIEKLKASKGLLASGEITHSYPHCWRCKNPIIFRATEQYFMGVDINNLRGKMLSLIKKVKWIPAGGIERISSMVKLRPDWCLSRQRYWGVPIPAFYCVKCKELLLDAKVIEHVAGIVEKEGSNAYFIKDTKELIPSGTKCKKCKTGEFIKEKDIVDVWFESGVSHQAVLKPEKLYPADLYLEGSDQHRGWFQTALITGAAIDGIAPYKTVLTHGFVVDGTGKKMSKSLGNVISPQDVMKTHGADILRLWVASSDYSTDVRLSDEILKRLSDSYRKIRNTLRYLLSNLYDYDASKKLDYKKLLEVDRWALARTKGLLDKVNDAYATYNFHVVYRSIYEFSTVFLSSIYLDVLKDRMYTFGVDSTERRSGQTAMYEIASALIRMLEPLIPFTAEEAWQSLTKKDESVHLANWPELGGIKPDKTVEEKYTRILALREKLLILLEAERIAKRIGSPLQAKVVLSFKLNKDYKFYKLHEKELPTMFIVSQVEVAEDTNQKEDIKIDIKTAGGAKCQRCWNYSETVGKNNKHPGLCTRCLGALN